MQRGRIHSESPLDHEQLAERPDPCGWCLICGGDIDDEDEMIGNLHTCAEGLAWLAAHPEAQMTRRELDNLEWHRKQECRCPTPDAPIQKVPADKAELIIAKAVAMPSPEANHRAFVLLQLDRKLTPEEQLELAVHLCKPTRPYIA